MGISNFLAGAAGGATVSIIISAKEQYSKELNKAISSTNNLSKAMRLGGIALGTVAAGMTAFGVASLKAAVDAETITKQFQKMTYNSDEFLVSLNKATYQTVSNFELMSSANKALMLGLQQDALPDFFEKAAILGQVAGRSVTEAVEDITLGVGSQSKLILDNLGIIVDAQAAYDTYATQIGKTASALNEAEKKAAFLQATLKGMDETIAKNNLKFEETASVKMQKLQKAFADLKVSVGNELLPTFSELTNALVENEGAWVTLGEASGKVLTAIVKGVAGVISKVGEMGDRFGNVIATFGKSGESLFAGDFEEAKKQYKIGMDRERFLKSGMSADEAIAKAQIPYNPISQGSLSPFNRGMDPLSSLVSSGKESPLETFKQISTETSNSLDETSEGLDYTTQELEKLAESIIKHQEIDGKSIQQLEEDLKIHAQNMDIKSQLIKEDQMLLDAIIKLKQGAQSASASLQAISGGSGGGGKGAPSGDIKYGSNVVYNPKTGTYVASGSSDDMSHGIAKFKQSAAIKGGIVNNYYTSNSSAQTRKVTGTV